jgi:hypothetical protein
MDDSKRKKWNARNVQGLSQPSVPAQTPNRLVEAQIVLVILSRIPTFCRFPHSGEQASQCVSIVRLETATRTAGSDRLQRVTQNENLRNV